MLWLLLPSTPLLPWLLPFALTLPSATLAHHPTPDLLVGGEPYEIVITAIAATPGTYVNSATLTADNQAGPVTETAAVTVTVRAGGGRLGCPALGEPGPQQAHAAKHVLLCPVPHSAARPAPSLRLQPPPSPILSLVKVADPVVVLNQDFTYALLATAAGGDVSGVTLVDTMPAGVKAVAVAPEGACDRGPAWHRAACAEACMAHSMGAAS